MQEQQLGFKEMETTVFDRTPCVFCGSPDPVFYPNDAASCGAEMGIPGSDAFYGHCDGCGADGPVADSMHEAIQAWNRRAAIPATAAERFQLDQMFEMIRHIDPHGSLSRLLGRHGIVATNPAIEPDRFVPCTEADAKDYRSTLAQAALALQYLITNRPGKNSSEPFNQAQLQALASAVDAAAAHLAPLARNSVAALVLRLDGPSAALRYYAAGYRRPSLSSSPFSAAHLKVHADTLEAAFTYLGTRGASPTA